MNNDISIDRQIFQQKKSSKLKILIEIYSQSLYLTKRNVILFVSKM